MLKKIRRFSNYSMYQVLQTRYHKPDTREYFACINPVHLFMPIKTMLSPGFNLQIAGKE